MMFDMIDWEKFRAEEKAERERVKASRWWRRLYRWFATWLGEGRG